MTSEREDSDISGFVAVINYRLASEGRIAKAKALAWLGAGTAVALSLTGLGILCSFYGYSFVYSVQPAAERTAKAFVEALTRTPLKTSVSGSMSLAQNSQVHLAPGQAVKLEEGGIVKLDPNSTVRVVAIDMPQPSSHQLGLEAKPKTDELPFTSYTIFRSVSFNSGEVVTGYNFELGDRLRPKNQYCYYTVSVGQGVAAKFDIARNGIPQEGSKLKKAEFDGALANCTWFSPD